MIYLFQTLARLEYFLKTGISWVDILDALVGLFFHHGKRLKDLVGLFPHAIGRRRALRRHVKETSVGVGDDSYGPDAIQILEFGTFGHVVVFRLSF